MKTNQQTKETLLRWSGELEQLAVSRLTSRAGAKKWQKKAARLRALAAAR